MGGRGRAHDAAGPRRLVRRLRGGERRASSSRCSPTAPSSRSNPRAAPGCTLHRSHPSDVARTEHLTFICQPPAGGRRPHQQLDGARRTRARRWARSSRASMKGRTMYVVPYVMGPLGSPFSKVGDRGHRQPLRRGQHADHDPHGRGRAGPARRRRRVRARACTRTGDLSPGPPLHRPLPRGAPDLERRLRLRRQRAARQEVLRAAHRQHHGPRPGLDGRAHAHPGARAAGRRDALHRPPPSPPPAARPTWPCWSRRFEAPGLQGADGRRRHRLAAARARTAGCGRSTRRPASSAWCPAPGPRPTPTPWPPSATTRSSPTWR